MKALDTPLWSDPPMNWLSLPPWPPLEEASDPFGGSSGVGSEGQVTERQMAERARDHLYT